MLDRLAERLSVRLPTSETIWESLALGNLMVALAWNRHYAYQAIGALGVIELTAPGRAKHVNAGLRRLGVNGGARRYFAIHATLDVKHSIAWNREVLRPLVAADARVATAIAESPLVCGPGRAASPLCAVVLPFRRAERRGTAEVVIVAMNRSDVRADGRR